jgi:cytidylate kinase
MLVAIDGPAGAGKSTVARAVADALDFTYLDTGAMYRAVALASLRGHGLPWAAEIGFADDGHVMLEGEDVEALIRTPEVSQEASRVAADPRVRSALVDRQRRLIGQADWVAEGRDIGTVVAPDAELKVFLTASPEERARRRAAELGADPAQILQEQTIRDERDSTRADSPLRAADDAVEVDTTGLGIDEVVAKIVDLARGGVPR